MTYNGKVAIITGSTSGMGRAEAKSFAQKEAQVVVIGRRVEAGNQVVEEIKAAGGEAIFIPTDITKKEQVDNMVKTVMETYGRIDILVNNAGVFDKYAPLLETDEELWDQIFATNIKGMYYVTHAILPIMLKQGGGSIVNIASVAGLVAGKGGAAYTASKHAVIGLTKHLSSEYARKGINVNAICPGTIFTPLIADVADSISRENIPIRRLGDPQEVAELCLFLASERARFVNGVSVPIDGGFTIQ